MWPPINQTDDLNLRMACIMKSITHCKSHALHSNYQHEDSSWQNEDGGQDTVPILFLWWTGLVKQLLSTLHN